MGVVSGCFRVRRVCVCVRACSLCIDVLSLLYTCIFVRRILPFTSTEGSGTLFVHVATMHVVNVAIQAKLCVHDESYYAVIKTRTALMGKVWLLGLSHDMGSHLPRKKHST